MGEAESHAEVGKWLRRLCNEVGRGEPRAVQVMRHGAHDVIDRDNR